MDWNGLRDQVSNLSLYDVKASIRKVQNAVMNYTEMEAKVREATNNEPWGASSTLMQEIANGTFNYQLLNEIMPMIYKRFTEKSAEEWRQIYKALQLMEFLVKNGSERVIDDARGHLSLLKMLRQFHYIDQNGKDQGLNVRNRSKELTDLLSDVDKIRAERKKARATRNKYGGVEGGAGMGSGGASSRYGGFEGGSSTLSNTYGGATRAVYGDGGGFGGEAQDEYDEGGRTAGSERFDEYDEYDDGGAQAAPGRRKADAAAAAAKKPARKAEAPKPKAPEVDLFDFGDEPSSSGFTAPAAGISSAPAAADDDDDFDDFQSAAPAAVPTAAPAAPSFPKPNYSSLSSPLTASTPANGTGFAPPPSSGPNYSAFSSGATTPALSNVSSPVPQPAKPSGTGYQPSGPNYYTSVPAPSGQAAPAANAFSGLGGVSTSGSQSAPKKTAAGGDAFASLLAGATVKKSGTAGKGLTIADMAKQKSQAGLYGANAGGAQQPGQASFASSGQKPNTGSSGLDDLLG